MKKILCPVICIAILLTMLCGCNGTNNDENDTTTTTTATTSSQVSETDNSFSNRDDEVSYNENASVKISLNGKSATATSETVKISGSTVTITENVTHIISGTLNDGMIIVDTPDTSKLQIVLNGVNITSSTSAPIYVKEADKVFVTVKGKNTLANSGTFNAIDENSIDGVIYSKQDITFNGTGTLNISSPAGHGIVGKDDVVFAGGTYNITSASHGIDANDSVKIKNTVISADAGKDGIHSENNNDTSKGYVYIESGSIDLECEGDGISGSAYVQIVDGTINIIAGGGYENGTKKSSDNWGGFGGGGMFGGGRPNNRGAESMSYSSSVTTTPTATTDDSTSMKGIKAGGNLVIDGGKITVDSADDSIHSDTSVTINKGTLTLATGDDGVHAEKTLTVKNGTINISNSYEGLEALEIYIKGGKIKLKSSDDGLNAAGGNDSSGTTGGRDGMFGGGMMGGMSSNSNGKIEISGGNVYINASGDGIDANGTLSITGGYTVITGPTQGDTATLDFDKTGVITGGTFIGTGAQGMAQTLSGSGQGVYSVSVGTQAANTKITLTDKNGKEIISHTPELDFQIVILSSPDIVAGETYTITIGSTKGTFEAT